MPTVMTYLGLPLCDREWTQLAESGNLRLVRTWKLKTGYTWPERTL